MPINRIIKYLYLGVALFFQFYLAYASTLYLEVRSLSFFLVVTTAICSAIIISYYILIRFEKENKGLNEMQ